MADLRDDGAPGLSLRVLCSESELQEYGEVLRVGERVCRLAGRAAGGYYGDELDEIGWCFDQYAQLVGDEARTLSGTVTAISAVFVNLERRDDGSWGPGAGSAQLEPIASTAETRRIREELVETWRSEPDEDGISYSTSVAVRRDGDEYLSGWLFTLHNARITPLPAPPPET